MQIVTAVRWGVLLVLGAALVGGCKKETPPKAETPQALPAPAPATALATADMAKTGEALFKQHCASCHPDGGNIIKPEYTLQAKSLAAHKISTPGDIVKIMRNPESGMTKFDEATIPEKDATEIALYIQNTFK